MKRCEMIVDPPECATECGKQAVGVVTESDVTVCSEHAKTMEADGFPVTYIAEQRCVS